MKKKKENKPPIMVFVIGGLFVVISLVFLLNQNRPKGSNGTGLTVNQFEATIAAIPRLSPQEAKDALERGEATFVDVRSKEAYQVSHIPGALSIPLGEIETRIGELNPNQWIITYCT